jgi:hypothetical protein
VRGAILFILADRLLVLLLVLDNQRPMIPTTLAAVDAAGIAAGNYPDVCRTAYRAVQPLHNRYMSDIGDNNRVA